MNKSRFLMTREMAVASAFAFFTYGKYVLAIFALVKVLRRATSNVVFRVELEAIGFFLFVSLIFLLAFYNGLINGNSIDHMWRNNFGSIIYLLVGLSIFFGSQKDDAISRLDNLIVAFKFWALCFLFIYLFLILSPEYRVNYTEYLSGAIGFNFHLSSLVGIGQYSKIFSGLLVIYLFLIPIAFLRRKSVPGAWYVFIVLILLTASFSQYLVLLTYAVISAVYVICVGKISRASMFLGPGVAILAIFLVGYTGLWGHVHEKVGIAIEVASGEADMGGINTVTRRILQARILTDEISDAPIMGHGLGYQSKKYNRIREGWGEMSYYNRSMYELQFLDVPMKFGLVGAGLIFALFIAYPMILISYIRGSGSSIKGVLFLGYLGVVLYALNNGNYFYSYATMFCWGLTVMLSLSYRNRGLIANKTLSPS